MTQSATPPPRHRTLNRLLLLAPVLLTAAGGYYLFNTSSLDRAIAGYRAKNEPILPEDFAKPPVPDAENAATYLLQAADALTYPQDTRPWLDKFTFELPLSPADATSARALTDANALAFALVAKARTAPALRWPGDAFAPGAIESTLARTQLLRGLANVARAAALADHAAGDHPAALARLRDGLFLARALDTDPILISHLTATGCTAGVCDTVRSFAPDLPVTAATRPLIRDLITALLDDDARKSAITDVFRRERAHALAQSRAQSRIISPLSVLDVIDTARAAALEDDYPAARRTLDKLPTTASAWSPSQQLARPLASSLARAVESDFRVLAARRLAAAQLAITAYRADHANEFPPTLEALTPKYLPTVPTDPFTSNQPIRYALTPTPRIYSVSTNATDDGGNATLPAKSSSPWNAPDYVVLLARPQSTTVPAN